MSHETYEMGDPLALALALALALFSRSLSSLFSLFSLFSLRLDILKLRGGHSTQNHEIQRSRLGPDLTTSIFEHGSRACCLQFLVPGWPGPPQSIYIYIYIYIYTFIYVCTYNLDRYPAPCKVQWSCLFANVVWNLRNVRFAVEDAAGHTGISETPAKSKLSVCVGRLADCGHSYI